MKEDSKVSEKEVPDYPNQAKAKRLVLLEYLVNRMIFVLAKLKDEP